MKRQPKQDQADAILTADWHLRETDPVCRTDNFVEETQWKKVDFVSNLQKQHDCPVLCAGDLFDYWKPSPWLLSKTIKHLPNNFWTVYGNHDLPQHSLDLAAKCGVYTLWMAYAINLWVQGAWQTLPENVFYLDESNIIKEKAIHLWHVMTYQAKEPYPDCTAPKANKLLRKYPQFDLIVTGDNHHPFVEAYEGRLLVNPGSLSRQKVDETHLPRIYLWYGNANTVKPVYIPVQNDVISNVHIKTVTERDKRIDAFVTGLNNEYKTTVSFDNNLKRFEHTNNIHKSIMEIIYKSIEK